MSSYVRLGVFEKRRENVKHILKSLINDWGVVEKNNISKDSIFTWESNYKNKLYNDYQKHFL